MGPFDGLLNCGKDEKHEKPDSSSVQDSSFSSVRRRDAEKWRTIDEADRHLSRDPDLMYTGRSF
jgi:hypothetical protein